MWVYHFGALLKIVVGLVILISIYVTIYPEQDPAIAMWFGFLGIFIVSRGISFYIFYLLKFISTHKEPIQCAKESYHLSLLFGMFILANGWLVLLWKWTKPVGVLLLFVFVAFQVVLSLTPDNVKPEDVEYSEDDE